MTKFGRHNTLFVRSLIAAFAPGFEGGVDGRLQVVEGELVHAPNLVVRRVLWVF